MTDERQPKVLVIRRKALGDALVCLPAVEALGEALGVRRLDLVIDRPFAPLVSRLTEKARVVAWPPDDGRWLGRLRDEAYDIVVDYLGSPRTALWTVLSAAPVRVGYELGYRALAYNRRVPRNRHGGEKVAAFAGEAFLDPLRALDLPAGPWRAGARRLRLRDGDLGKEYEDWAETFFEGDVCRVGIMLSATWPAKAWPAERGARLARLLADAGRRPLFILGPGDEMIGAVLKREAPEIEFAPATTLLELAHLIEGVDCFVGTDCGPRHLAACLGRPTVTVFGPTSVRGWSIADPSHAAVTAPTDCAPCDLTECPVPGHPCLDEVAAEMVERAIARVLGAAAAPKARGGR